MNQELNRATISTVEVPIDWAVRSNGVPSTASGTPEAEQLLVEPADEIADDKPEREHRRGDDGRLVDGTAASPPYQYASGSTSRMSSPPLNARTNPSLFGQHDRDRVGVPRDRAAGHVPCAQSFRNVDPSADGSR